MYQYIISRVKESGEEPEGAWDGTRGLWPSPVPCAPSLHECERDGGLRNRVRLAVAARLDVGFGDRSHLQQAARDRSTHELDQLVLAGTGLTHRPRDLGAVLGGAVGRRELLVAQRTVQRHPRQHLVAEADRVDRKVDVDTRHPNFASTTVAAFALGADVTLHAPHRHQLLKRRSDLATDAGLEAQLDRDLILLVVAGRDPDLTSADEPEEHPALQVCKPVFAELLGCVDLHTFHDSCHVLLLIFDVRALA